MVPDPAVEPNGISRIGSGAGSVQARNEWITRFTGSWSGSDLGAGSHPELPNEA